MHPVRTLEMTETHIIKHAYKHRIKTLENSIGGFVINIVFKRTPINT
jgi:all-trans-retinol 13,14-reductase